MWLGAILVGVVIGTVLAGGRQVRVTVYSQSDAMAEGVMLNMEARWSESLPVAVRPWAPLLWRASGGDLERATLLAAVVQVESSGRPEIVSRTGAVGLMQVQPATARDLHRWYGKALPSPARLRDPRVNIAFGARYLDRLIRRFGDLRDALEAYYRGPRAVARWRRRGETRRPYADRVLRVMGGRDVSV